MMNNKEKIVKKLLFDIIDKLSKDADVYNHNGSLWLINTDSTRWIFEFTKSKTLWYNYNFFRSALKFVSLDINEGDNQKYITEWFESRYLNINQVKHTLEVSNPNPPGVEETVQNGVKDIRHDHKPLQPLVEDAIQNGVKQTELSKRDFFPEDIFQNGVKHTKKITITMPWLVEETIQNGVKDTKENWSESKYQVEDTIQNGVKHTEIGWVQDNGVEDAVKNGVKHTEVRKRHLVQQVEDTIQKGVKDTRSSANFVGPRVEETIQHGVKDTRHDHKPLQPLVDNAIENGVKETRLWLNTRTTVVEGAIQNGVKDTESVVFPLKFRVEDAIQNGVKETKENRLLRTASVMNTILDGVKHVEDGVKEIKSDEGYLPHFGQQYKAKQTIQNGVKETLSTAGKPLRVEDAIENGVKKTYSTLRRTKLGVDDIIQNGVKDTKPMDEWVNAESIIEDTIEYGVKELQPLPAQDGNRDWGNYYRGKEDRTKPFNVYLDDAIRFGVKEVIKDNHHRTREVVVTIKDGVKETHQDCSNNIARVEGIIRVGEKLD